MKITGEHSKYFHSRLDFITSSFAAWFEIDDARNNKVYVSNLPEETTEEEFLELMQKCGMVLKDVMSNKYKVKMYRDGDGNFKGDALCTYIKVCTVTV